MASGGMNKMFAILPVYFLSTKLDWEDQNTINTIRLGYFFEQFLLIIGCAYLYFKVQGLNDRTIIFVKKAASFAEPKPAWLKSTYCEHENAELLALAQQLVLGLVMTTFLHFKMDIKQSILMQACMMPITFIDCKVVQRYFMGKGNHGERCYDELLDGEEIPKEDNEGEEGSKEEVVTKASSEKTSSSSPKKSTEKSTIQRLIQGTWDSGKSAKYDALLKALTPSNVDTKTDSDFTALMVVAAGAGDVTSFVEQVMDKGADVHVVDDEGWTALHWAAFHGNLFGVTALVRSDEGSKLLATKDFEGHTAKDLAQNELETVQRELKVLLEEIKSQNDENDMMSKQQIEVKEAQVKTKQDIVDILSSSSTSSTTTENLHEID